MKPEATATLYTLARISNVGGQFLAMSGGTCRPGTYRRPDLPRTFEEYRSGLYGPRQRDLLPGYGWGVIASLLSLVVIGLSRFA